MVQVLGNSTVLSMAAGDINGDGATDLVVGTAAGQPIQIYPSDGFRGFLMPPISLADNSANEGIMLADFDNNGTLIWLSQTVADSQTWSTATTAPESSRRWRLWDTEDFRRNYTQTKIVSLPFPSKHPIVDI